MKFEVITCKIIKVIQYKTIGLLKCHCNASRASLKFVGAVFPRVLRMASDVNLNSGSTIYVSSWNNCSVTLVVLLGI